MLLLLPSVASKQRRGKLCHSISIQSTYFVRQLSVENVRVFIFVSVTPLYSSSGPFNMAPCWLQFPKNILNPNLFLRSVGKKQTVLEIWTGIL